MIYCFRKMYSQSLRISGDLETIMLFHFYIYIIVYMLNNGTANLNPLSTSS